jgi:hypothetical protein
VPAVHKPTLILLAALVATLTAPTGSGQTLPCTKELAAGGDVDAFVDSLTRGDVGCLHGGTYTPSAVTMDGVGAELRSHPGEQAYIDGTQFTVRGPSEVRYLILRNSPNDGFSIQGNGVNLIHNHVLNSHRHGAITGSTSSNVRFIGNTVRGFGDPASGNLDHGIYLQGNNHVVARNIVDGARAGYGIHIYGGGRPDPDEYVVSGNVTNGSATRPGILIDSNGNGTVVNNISTNNETAGVRYRRCSAGGCVVNNNITWGSKRACDGGLCQLMTNNRNVDPQYVDGQFHVAGTSPAVDTGVSPVFYPDLNGVAGQIGAAPDLGAYER